MSAAAEISSARGPGAPGAPNGKGTKVDIIDVRRAPIEADLKDDILALISPEEGPRMLPTLLLYDEKGLQLFEDITYLEEYYLTNDEIALLEKHSTEIAKAIPSGSMMVELGSGNLRKVSLLLGALEASGKTVDYYALDLSKAELERTLGQLPAYQHVGCHGLFGTYDDGREWLKAPSNASRRKCILTLGSSIGNFSRREAAEFLKEFANVLHDEDVMLVGLDGCHDPGKIYRAYNDSRGVTHQFILNGLKHANRILGNGSFKLEDWEVHGEYVFDDQGGRHQAFYSPVRDTVVMGEIVRAYERIAVEQSLKYSKEEAEILWRLSGMTETGLWENRNQYGLHMLSKSKMAPSFSTHPASYASSALPTIADWEGLWVAWDAVTRGMLPTQELLNKPIKLRNACIFYLGHIPTFLDIQITKVTGAAPTEPASYYAIFERGIDPDVDDPELCHAHSEIPDEWPPLDRILAYQARVRDRVRDLYATENGGSESVPRSLGRALWVGFEHEAMHLETLLYMMLQSDKTLPPPGTPRPDWEHRAAEARSARVPNQWFDVPAQDIAIGIDDPEDGSDPNTHYGWDNEKPLRRAQVGAFQAKGRPITNGEYAEYMRDEHVDSLPAAWTETGDATTTTTAGVAHTNGATGLNGYANGHSNGGHANGASEIPPAFLENKAVRTVYGPVPLKYALDWPVFASYDELSGCASWMGGRIPTFEEARAIYAHAQSVKKDKAERTLGKTVPAVNGHLSNDGVEETPPSRAFPNGAAGGEKKVNGDLFLDLGGANVGFRYWHPAPVTAAGGRLAGQAEMGGVWEWTSTPLAPWDGFEPMSLYPGYTADFFDGKHNIVLGGSWATHPRIAGRRSFINWFQRNYPYAWCGARVVRDKI